MHDNLIKDIVYLLGAWERGADAEDYANEIATIYHQLLHQPEQDYGFDRTASHMTGEYVCTESSNDFDPDWDTVEPYLDYISQLQEKLQGLSKIKELADYRLKLLMKMPSECAWLTDKELSDTYNFHYNDCASNNIDIVDFLAIARVVIARLKDKNNE